MNMKYITPSETAALVLLDGLPKPQKKAAFQRLLHDSDRVISFATKMAARTIVDGDSRLPKRKRYRTMAKAKRKAK
jgi:hypothetical protein